MSSAALICAIGGYSARSDGWRCTTHEAIIPTSARAADAAADDADTGRHRWPQMTQLPISIVAGLESWLSAEASKRAVLPTKI